MPNAQLRTPFNLSLPAVYFALVILVGNLAAAYVVLTDAGVVGLWQAIWQGGTLQQMSDRILDFTRGTILGNPTFYLLLVLGLIAEWTHIPLPKGGRMTAGFLIAFAALLMLGLPAALLLVSFVSIVSILFSRAEDPIRAAFFNVGQYSLAYVTANFALSFGHVYIPGFPGPDDYGHVALATLAFLVSNFLIVDGYLALAKRIPLWRIIWEDDRTEIVVTLALSPMALLMATMYASQQWWGISIVLIPLFATAYFVRLFLKVKQAGQELAEYNQQLTILQEVATKISSQIDLDQTLTLISQEIRRVVGYHDCMIFLLDEKTNTLVRQLSADPFLPQKPLQVPMEHGVMGQVAREKQSLQKSNLAAESLDVGVLSGYRSLLAVPIQTEQEVLGVLALLHQHEGAFDASDERLLKILASQAAVAIKNAQLHRATQQLAVTDGLTKVFNRRYFEEQLSAELNRAQRHDHTTSLIMLDVDHFKKLNDTHGHLIGDQVLQGVARVLQKSTRDTDLVARYGGEEFAVVLPETPPEAALEVAERIRRNVKSHPFWGRQQTPLEVTISVGLASDPTSSLATKALIDQADTSLYQAKRQGRDRVCRTVYKPDEPMEVTESRQEQAPEPTLRRPSRAVANLSADDWERYLQGHVESVFQGWWGDPRVNEVLGEEALRFWRGTADEFVGVLIRKLESSEEERNAWLENFHRHPLYRPIQAELARLIQNGVTMTQMEYTILGFYKRMQALVQGAPFSLEERMTVGSVQERLFHVLQLMVSQVWHDFFQATSEHLFLVSELETRLSADFQQAAVLEEIASLTAKALGADACLVFTPDEEAKSLIVQAAWGIRGINETWTVPMGQGLAGACFETREALLVPSVEDDARLYRPFYAKLYENRPVRSALMVPLVSKERSLGVLFCMSEHKDHFSPLDARLGQGIGARLATALERQRQEAERQARYLEAVSTLAKALEQRKEAQGSSSKNQVLEYAMALGEAMALPGTELEALRQAGRLYDIGELGIPDSVFTKPTALDEQEKALVRHHPLMGARILGYIEALREVVPIVRHHHERMDGTGYPDGLKGGEIPMLARILAVADAFHAMTTPRPYRQAMTPKQALEELKQGEGFDPEVVERLERIIK